MGRITGFETKQEVPPKVLLIYQAVEQLIEEGADFSDIRVSTITDRAGIGKGTAYEYFDSKEEILACAVLYSIKTVTEGVRSILADKERFTDKIICILEEVDRHGNNRQCLMRYIHVMTDHSNFNRLVRGKMHMEGMGKYLPAGMIADMLTDAVKQGEVRGDLPIDYMVYMLFSRLLSYLICIGTGGIVGMDQKQIRDLECQSILTELCAKNV